MLETTAAVDWENSTMTQGMSPMTSGRWPGYRGGEGSVPVVSSDATEDTRDGTVARDSASETKGAGRTGGDEIALAGVDGDIGSVLVLDLHRAALEVAEVVGGAPLGAARELGADLGDPVESGLEDDLHGGLIAEVDDVRLGLAHVLVDAVFVVDLGHPAFRGWSSEGEFDDGRAARGRGRTLVSGL